MEAHTVIDRIRSHFGRIDDLVESLPVEALGSRLPVSSSTIGAQLWCVIGARESYARALGSGEWSGFTCSLEYGDRHDRDSVRAALARSSEAFEAAASEAPWDESRAESLLALLEHEAQHQGQLIRYLYGLDLPIPQSWAGRWALS